MLALLYTVHSYEKTIQVNHYDAMDKMYFDLRMMAYENPAMDQPDSLLGENKKKDPELKKVWYGVIQAEYKIHKKWITESNAKAYFEPTFLRFLKRFDNEDLENIIASE